MDLVDEQIDATSTAFLGMTSPAAATITSSTQFRRRIITPSPASSAARRPRRHLQPSAERGPTRLSVSSDHREGRGRSETRCRHRKSGTKARTRIDKFKRPVRELASAETLAAVATAAANDNPFNNPTPLSTNPDKDYPEPAPRTRSGPGGRVRSRTSGRSRPPCSGPPANSTP